MPDIEHMLISYFHVSSTGRFRTTILNLAISQLVENSNYYINKMLQSPFNYVW